MAALSALASYGDSDSSEGEDEVIKAPKTSKVATTSFNHTLLRHDKDKSGKVKVYLPQVTSPETSPTKPETDTKNDTTSNNTTKGLKGLMSVLPQPKNRRKLNQTPSTSSSFSSTSFLSQVTKSDVNTTSSSRKRPGGSSLFIPYTLTSKTSKTTETTTETTANKSTKKSDNNSDSEDDEEEKGGGSFLFLKESEEMSLLANPIVEEPPLQGPYLEDPSVQPYSTAAQSYSTVQPYSQPYSTYSQPYSTVEPYPTVQPYSKPYSTTQEEQAYSTVQQYSEGQPYSTVQHTEKYYSEGGTLQPPQSEDDLELNEDIVRRLAGKRRGQKMDEETASLQHVKNVTETEVKDSVKVFQKYSTEQSATSGTVPEHLAFTSDQKRKHQITWLAHQAKSREIELKNFWAESAAQRRQTKMKYGF